MEQVHSEECGPKPSEQAFEDEGLSDEEEAGFVEIGILFCCQRRLV